MIRVQRALVCCAALALGTVGCASLHPRPSLQQEREAVVAAMASGSRALEEHDWPAYAAFWANDADVEVLHPAAREWVTGWDSTASKYRVLIADTTVSYRISNVRQNVHLSPSRDMAWVTQEDRIEFTTAGRTRSMTQWSTSVFEKRGGRWRLVHAHASIPPAPARPSSP